jgi:hypothetical protein
MDHVLGLPSKEVNSGAQFVGIFNFLWLNSTEQHAKTTGMRMSSQPRELITEPHLE